MRRKRRAPSHPGGILLRQYMEPLDLGVSDIAKALGVSRKTMSKIVNERGSITADMALRLSQAFQTTPQLWLNLQQNYDLWCAESNKGWKYVDTIAA